MIKRNGNFILSNFTKNKKELDTRKLDKIWDFRNLAVSKFECVASIKSQLSIVAESTRVQLFVTKLYPFGARSPVA